MEIWGFVERVKDREQILTGFGFEDDLPAVTGVSALVKGRHRRGDDELRNVLILGKLNNFCVQFADVLDGRFFGFVSQRKFEQKTVGRKGTLFTLLKQVFIKVRVVAGGSVGNYGVIGLETLYKNIAVLMTTFSAAEHLGD